MPRPAWPPEQEQALRRLIPNTPVKEIARLIGRTAFAVRAKWRAISNNQPMAIPRDDRVEQMVELTERIERCRYQLNRMSTAR